MNNTLLSFTINKNSNLLTAMEKINKNEKGFLIVLDNNQVCGVITDGDIRRDLIKSKILKKKIDEVYNPNFKYLSLNDGFVKVVEYFKENNLKFLPIIDENKKLCNIITKTNLHSLLLQNIIYDPNYDFFSIDDSLLEHEIYPRPWGFYKTVILNDFCQCKIITIKEKSSISLQKHLKREEYWIIINGCGKAVVGDKILDVNKGSTIYIPKNTIHRLSNTSSTKSLILTEVQLGDYFGEDDIIRLKDDYNRV